MSDPRDDLSPEVLWALGHRLGFEDGSYFPSTEDVKMSQQQEKEIRNMGSEGFPGFSPTADIADRQDQVNRAMVLLGRRPDLRDQLRINPEPARKRPTGGWNVFNLLGSSGEFNESPQLLLWVGCEEVSARVVLPNRAWPMAGKKRFKWAFVMARVLKDMRSAMADCPGMTPRLILKQRHWPQYMRSGPCFQDAYLEVDLRTIHGDGGRGVKEQREWIEAAQMVFTHKRSRSNFELQVGAAFRFEHCSAIQGPDALSHVAAAWIGCRFFIELLRG